MGIKQPALRVGWWQIRLGLPVSSSKPDPESGVRSRALPVDCRRPETTDLGLCDIFGIEIEQQVRASLDEQV